MAIVPLRNLGQLGIIPDVDPYDLPINAFNFGKNVRFENNTIYRGSVFRRLGSATLDTRNIFGYIDGNNNTQILTFNRDGTSSNWTPGSQVDISATGWTPQVSEAPITVTAVNNLVFVNRPDRVPWFRSKNSVGHFATLPEGAGQWDESWRAQVLTSVAGVVVALNITKGAQALPNDVLWSDFVQYDTPPNWNLASTEGSAGENTLASMQEPIVDGVPLKSRLMIYSRNETWFMDYIGGNEMFRFDRQFDRGVIGTNCVIETNGMHYVFGSNDIWLHDGISQKSIAQGRVRRYIYDSMRRSKSDLFFTTHSPEQNEVMFCYVSDDPFVAFPTTGGEGCNRAAIYNYASDTWYFADLPYVTCAARTASISGKPFDNYGQSYDSQGGSFASQEGDNTLVLVMGSYSTTASGLQHSLRTYAPYDASATSYPLDTAASPGAFLFREGMDLDELNAELRGYKMASSIYPEGRLTTDADPLVFTMGSADNPMAPVSWGNSQTYDATFYRLDHNIAGRYLSYKMEQTDCKRFTLSGFDIDLTILGAR